MNAFNTYTVVNVGSFTLNRRLHDQRAIEPVIVPDEGEAHDAPDG